MDRATVMAGLRQPKAAAVAGLVFGLILGAVLVLVQSVAPENPVDAGAWVEDEPSRHAIATALGLVPFAGIAFLWFVAVVRSQLGRLDDRFFETAFLGSGLLFVAMLFSAAAVLGSVLTQLDAGVALAPGAAAEAWTLAASLLGVFGARMAAVFALTVTTVARRAGSLPRFAAGIGYLCGVMLLLTPPLPRWAQFLFPVWVIAISLIVLVRRPTAPR